MADKLHPIIKRAGRELADGKLDRREFLRVATLLGISDRSLLEWRGCQAPLGRKARRRRAARCELACVSRI